MAKPWKKYQEDAASYFRSLGLEAHTDMTVQGVRTTHDIDVYVKSHHAGFDIQWLVECKRWKTKVSKLHVLALREIVADVGADRGILLSEVGFQSGAIEAANLTNIQVTSILEMRESASGHIYAMRLRDLYDRIMICKDKYWEIPKDKRIIFGLRPDVGGLNYSGARIIEMCGDLLKQAFRGVYPIKNDSIEVFIRFGKGIIFYSPKEIVDLVDQNTSELEAKLDEYERRVQGA